MAPAHFSRNYLNGRRITRAKNLFRTSARSLTEIAVFLVSAEPTGLARIFIKLTGPTPSFSRSLSEIPRQKAFFA